MPINVLIADDEELITDSLKFILGYDEEIKVTGTCRNGEEAFRKTIEDSNIDVILMDIRMPVCDGVLATKRIMEIRPNVKIIILTTFNDDEYIFEALKNGAKGYILKNVKPDKIAEAIKVVYEGNLLMHPKAALRLSSMLHMNTSKCLHGYNLSEIEVQIIKLISDGLTNKEIADRVFLSEGTVKNKITDILNKLHLRDRTQIAIFYLKGCVNNVLND